MDKNNTDNRKPRYKRGTFIKDGKMYGRYPDGAPYRIYTNTENCRQFLELVNEDGVTVLHVRQATEQGYAVVPVWGSVRPCLSHKPTAQGTHRGRRQTGERHHVRSAVRGVR